MCGLEEEHGRDRGHYAGSRALGIGRAFHRTRGPPEGPLPDPRGRSRGAREEARRAEDAPPTSHRPGPRDLVARRDPCVAAVLAKYRDLELTPLPSPPHHPGWKSDPG